MKMEHIDMEERDSSLYSCFLYANCPSVYASMLVKYAIKDLKLVLCVKI